MLIIDADAHVSETEHTWDHLVTRQTNDDLAYVVKHAGDGSIVIGTDYGHFDASTEVDAISAFREAQLVPPALTDKIFCDNPKALYGIPDQFQVQIS